jgi:Dinucleotide-utilizing enzymes involved in molybdopterin and thiamine biosynthesis family 1
MEIDDFHHPLLILSTKREDMSNNQFIRTEFILGNENMNKIRGARVAVFGVGGVGGYVVEALARSGIGTLDLIDHDIFVESNLNRQILATYDTLGRSKVDVAEERIHAICSDIKVNKYPCFYLPKEKDKFDFTQYDYIVDAVDTVTAKINLIEEAQRCGVPIISSMGCGNRIDPTKLVVTDIYQTAGDPLARIMRYELRKRGIKKLKVVYSTEKPMAPVYPEGYENNPAKPTPGSTVFVPGAAGLLIASQVIRDLIDG